MKEFFDLFLGGYRFYLFRLDRFLRGGDHKPFTELGYAALRMTEPKENYTRQHQDPRTENGIRYGDFPENEGIELVGKLFNEDDVRVFEGQPVEFRCRCTAQRAEDVLRMLGEAEIREAIEEQGSLEVICEYCGRVREYDSVDASRLFADNVVRGPDSVQ